MEEEDDQLYMGKPRMHGSNPEGGMIINDPNQLILNTIKLIMKDIGSQIISGKFDVWKISTPAQLHGEMTTMNILCTDMSNCSLFLNQAAKEEDPQKRIKLVAAYYFSGLHISTAALGPKAPLNPILGETLQREMPDGTKFFAEQTSHHPPVTSYQLVGPD